MNDTLGRSRTTSGMSGDFTLDAAVLARALGRPVGELRELMRRGLVTSRVERGEGEDRGRWRLSVRCGNRQWRGTVQPDGTITDQHTDFVASPATARDAARGGGRLPIRMTERKGQ